MKKYSFRLQPVLDIRENVLEDKRLEMAKVIKVLNEQQDELTEMLKKQETYNNNLDNITLEDGSIDINAISSYKNYLVWLAQDIRRQEQVIEKTKKVLLVKQQDVNEALKDVKVLEKLKETQSQKFYKEIEEKEAREIDDIATTRYKRQSV